MTPGVIVKRWQSLQSRLKQAQTKIKITTKCLFVQNHITLRRLIMLLAEELTIAHSSTTPQMYFTCLQISTSFTLFLSNMVLKFMNIIPGNCAKTIVIDDWVIVGSSNLNHRSLLHLKLTSVFKKPFLAND